MVPANLTVAPGTTVKFQMTSKSYEAHTATFGPGNIDDPKSYVGGIAASFESPQIDPKGVYPSDVAPVAVNAALHGNGFWNSGVLDSSSVSTRRYSAEPGARINRSSVGTPTPWSSGRD